MAKKTTSKQDVKKPTVVSLGQSVKLDGEIKWPENSLLVERIEHERQNGIDYRTPFVSEWHENENYLYGKKPKTLSKRSNIMIPLMAGFEDTLLSRLKTPISMVFGPTESSDVNKARKVTALRDFETSVTREDWEFKDIMTKKLAMVSGRGINKIYSEYPYLHRLDPIDHYDFWVDPLTNGLSLESARYLGQDNIIISKAQLEANKSYDKKNVAELIKAFSEDNEPNPDNENEEKANRISTIGANYNSYLKAGDASYTFTEAYTEINGIRAYVLYNREKKIIIKKRKLSEITGFLNKEQRPFYPFESWAYYPDLFNFWSPSPMSRVREIFILRNVSLNQIFDNSEAKNKPTRAYDPKTFTDPSRLVYSPDAWIPVEGGRDPSKGTYTFPTESIIDPQQVSTILEDLAAKITGISSGASGVESSTTKVGIYYGNMQEIEKRMTLFELSYNRFHLRLGAKYLLYAKDRLDKETAIKVIGPNGVEYEEITQDDLVDFDITITGGLSQANEDLLTKKAKGDFLAQNALSQLLNQRVRLELGMGLAGFGQDDIKRALEPNLLDEKQLIRADEDIQKLLLGTKFKQYLKADTTYMQRLFDYVMNNDLDKKDEETLLTYLREIQPIVIRNMYLKAQMDLAKRGMQNTGQQPGPAGDSPMLEGAKNAMPASPNDVNSQGAATMQEAGTIPSAIQSQY
jgi:hypothetical protein